MMKRTLLAAIFSVSLFSLPAQITVTNSDMPAANDSVRLSIAVGTSVAYANTGPNYLWDFSSLVPSAQEVNHYLTPAALPFNFLSTVAVLNPSPDSLPFIGTVPSDFTDYFKNGSSGYRQNGMSFTYSAITSLAIPVLFSSNDYVFRFPMNYNTQDSSDAAYNFSIPNLAYIGQTRHRVNQMDGWGTVITPYGSFNVLRVKSILDITDTISIDTLGTGFSIPRPTEVQYKWVANGMKIPVLEIDCQLLFNTEVISSITYQDSMRDSVLQVGIPETVLNISHADVFPNPTSDFSNLTYELSNAGNIEMNIVDLSGRNVKEIENGFQNSGMHFQQINLDGIAAGIYFLQIRSGSSIISKKLVISN